MELDFQRIIDQLDDTIYISDPDTYEMLYINRCGLNHIPQQYQEYVGKPCYKVLQGLDAPCPFCNNHLLKADEFFVWEHANPSLHRHFLLKDKLLKFPDGRMARMEVAIDITEKELLSETIRERLEMQEALVTCLRYMSPPNTFEDAVQSVLSELANYHESDRAYIFEFNFEAKIAQNTYEWCANGVQPQMNSLQAVPMDLIKPYIDDLCKDNVISLEVTDAFSKKYPGTADLLRSQSISSLVAAPLRIADATVGMIGVDNPRKHRDASLMKSLSFFVVSELKKRLVEEALDHTRRYDSLTQLPNFESHMEYLDKLRRNPLNSIGVVTADINALKEINERYGPAYGDIYLSRLARILEQVFPEGHVFRIGGDEFQVLWDEAPHQDFLQAVRLLEHQLEKEPDFSVSVGQTWADSHIEIDNLISYADRLMTLHKQDFYRTHTALKNHPNSMMLEDLQAALRNGQFLPYLQPKMDAPTGRLNGAEVLVRRLDPEKGIIPPQEFIVRLEREGFIKYLDFYMIDLTCQLLERWVSQGLKPICVSVNVSRVTLMESDFVEQLVKIQSKYRFPRRYLEVEMTERVGKIERETLISTASALHREGFVISLDDFGAEYSSLSLLTTLDMDIIKLDKSLIDAIARSKKSADLAESIVDICHKFGMKCIAEGVENSMQLAVLQKMHCDYIQGYLFSPPIPLKAFEKKYHEQLFSQ